jgi:hypothetical protein
LVDAAENMKENIISLFRGEIKNIIRVKKWIEIIQKKMLSWNL